MNVFELRDQVIQDYSSYIQSYIQIRDEKIAEKVNQEILDGALWPDPLIQLNPSFASGGSIEDLVRNNTLHPECINVFRAGKKPDGLLSDGHPLILHKHQIEAIEAAKRRENYVLTTGTGSGKSLSYIIPIVEHVLQRGSGKGIQAIVVYPMNALANSQLGELKKFLKDGYPEGKEPVTFGRYTGQESKEERERLKSNPPDILLTNYVMLELILTRSEDKLVVKAAQDLQFLVFDELHTYRGRQGADVAMLIRRVRDILDARSLLCVGTSATLAGPGTYDEQRREVADVASKLFGAEVKPQNIIGETLKRSTDKWSLDEPSFKKELTQFLSSKQSHPTEYKDFILNPLAIWIESTFGVHEVDGRLVRCKPLSLLSAAKKLSNLTGIHENSCVEAIQKTLMGGYSIKDPEKNFPAFAFRLHQFISKGDTVYASIEEASQRHITLQKQQYVPGEDRRRVLYPLVFCRECGQEYYSVRQTTDRETGHAKFIPFEFADYPEEENIVGYLYRNPERPWPTDEQDLVHYLPDDLVEYRNGGLRIKDKKWLPQPYQVTSEGKSHRDGIEWWFIRRPFRFCPACGVSHGARQRNDFGKLGTLGTEGRSTATTVLSTSVIRHLREHDLPEEARKLLTFTDNRQDASLQAGHFNDFVEIAILRAGLFRAVQTAGPEGIPHDLLAQKAFEALDFSLDLYATNPEVKYQHLSETQRAFRDVLGYRLYRDLKRGWRIMAPNLEQSGLLVIDYLSLDDICHDEDLWRDKNILNAVSPETRAKISRVLLDHMRRELAIKVDYLDPYYQEQFKKRSFQRLIAPWAIDENERLEYSAVLYPRSGSQEGDSGTRVYLSALGGFGQYLRRKGVLDAPGLKKEGTEAVIRDLLAALAVGGILEEVEEGKNDVPGYQLLAGALLWKKGEGKRAAPDPIRMPQEPETGAKTNPFFVEFYQNLAADLVGLQAREHTAQVSSKEREDREEDFRKAKLPILFCSPTMELGIDIKQLNIVGMRNVPPTPANYAQRSGRAGRSGQPALVFTYCSAGNSHDQYFFKRPEEMVSGEVTPPRTDLSNEDLIRAHVQAIWLTETGGKLGTTLKEVLDLSGETPSLELLPSVKAQLSDHEARKRARARARRVLATIEDDLKKSDWYRDDWLDRTLDGIMTEFEKACDRWRGLYRAALAQMETQHRVIKDASRSSSDKEQAKRLRAEAEAQLKLLSEGESIAQSDFYSYRYFASEGFLPGYSFPRLPLSAYISGRGRPRQGQDEYISRPRFLAITEFGPRSTIYHDGARYSINRVIMAARGEDEVLTGEATICSHCGTFHEVRVDCCQNCGKKLDLPLRGLFRLQNVSTKRLDRITSDEEERQRLGYEVKTAIHFAEYEGRASKRLATVEENGNIIATLTYGQAATIWRINLGWRNSQKQPGFILDVERGYWANEKKHNPDPTPDDPMSHRTERVIPYVEDHRNCLLFEPGSQLGREAMASLQAALKSAIQVHYQLEDGELAAEPLPSNDERRVILLYEASEGGAGVLRRLVDDAQAIGQVARKALAICHFDPDSGQDLKRSPGMREDCEAACYHCLMNYGNQRDHLSLDRKLIRRELHALAQAQVQCSSAPTTRKDHLEKLVHQCESSLERDWLAFLEKHNLKLPEHGQHLFEEHKVRADFYYSKDHAVVFVDGPMHDFSDRRAIDEAQVKRLKLDGYTVLRFRYGEDWTGVIEKYPNIFGKRA